MYNKLLVGCKINNWINLIIWGHVGRVVIYRVRLLIKLEWVQARLA